MDLEARKSARAAWPNSPSAQRASGYAALASAGMCWGTGFPFSKFALRQLSVGHLLLLRFALGSLGLCMVLAVEWHRKPFRLAAGDIRLVLMSAAIGVPVLYFVQFEGLARTTVSHASLMVAMMPVLLAAGAMVFVGERPSVVGWCSLAASAIGATLVAFGGGASRSDHATLMGDALVALSLIAGVVWVLTSQRLIQRGVPPGATSALVICIGTGMLAVGVLATIGAPPLASLSTLTWASVIELGLLPTTLATLLWNWGVARVPASRAAVFVNLEPAVGAILGVVLFRDAFGALSIVGGAAIVASAAVMSLRPVSAR